MLERFKGLLKAPQSSPAACQSVYPCSAPSSSTSAQSEWSLDSASVAHYCAMFDEACTRHGCQTLGKGESQVSRAQPPLPPLSAAGGRRRKRAVMLVFHNANSGVKNHGFVANSGVRCLRENVLCFFES